MSRIILAIATVLVAGTVVYNKVAIAQFFQSKDNEIYASDRKWNQGQRYYANNYFNLTVNKEFLDNYQAQTGSNVWFMNAWDGTERESRNTIETPRRQQGRSSYSRAQETSTINLDSQALQQPHYLTVSAERDTQIIGQITLDGKAIQNIRGNRTTINLSNCLSRGRHLIEVFGNYRPASSSVQVEFSAPGTRVSQATGGNGVVRQTLILDVR